ncbi:cytochrome P450 [Artemisia annua]|uniref:Cytochrome P450 n=1 Tax=Artemisia annua TaxID=35608 RepID=A0A2U1KQ85_ARTAN|nr:cytochrome P450 [Artemisia annua]
MANELLRCRFSAFKTPSACFVPDERVVWVEVSGLPLGAWRRESIQELIGDWGKCVFFLDDWERAYSICKVCILAKSQKYIVEELQAEIDNKKFDLWMKEFAMWEPRILGHSSDSSDSEMSSQCEEDTDEVSTNDDDGIPSEQFNHNLCRETSHLNFGNSNDEKSDSNSKDCNGGSRAEKDPDDIFSLDAIFEKELAEKKKANSCPPNRRSVEEGKETARVGHDDTNSGFTSESFGAPGFVKGLFKNSEINCKGDFSLKTNKEHREGDSCSTFESSNMPLDPKEILEIGENMGFKTLVEEEVAIKQVQLLDLDCYMVNIYAPQQENDKVELWNKIKRFMEANRGTYILCGDFNSVRRPDERMGTIFSKVNAVNFNSFIESADLFDMPLGRHKYTRISIDGTKASRLDRVLVTLDTLDKVPELKLEALDDILSDHRPLLLFIQKLDFGPTPFKFFNSWLDLEGFDDVVDNSWKNSAAQCNGEVFNMVKVKLKSVKNDIKAWKKEKEAKRNRDTITKEIASIDLKLSMNNNDSLATNRRALITELQQMEINNGRDLHQKLKVKWGVEGDENSKFYHAIINKRRRQNTLNGIKHNGLWITNVIGIKQCFRDYFANK